MKHDIAPREYYELEKKVEKLPANIKRKVIEQKIKFINENAQLIAQLVTGKLELKMLKLEENLDLEKIIARKAELEKVKIQLKENFERHHLAVLSVVPPDFRQHFMMEGGMMEHAKGMWPMMMGMGHEGMHGMMGMGMMKPWMKGGCHGGHWQKMKKCGMWPGMMKSGMMGGDPTDDEHEMEEGESKRCCPTCGCSEH